MLIKLREIKEKFGVNPKGVIHVGGHYGEEAQEYFDCGIENSIWVEANESHIKTLLDNVIGKFKKADVYCSCLSDEVGIEKVFNVANNEGQSSSILPLHLHKESHPEVVYVDQKVVITNTLDNLLKDEDLSDYDFLNADIQGAELMMLKGATNVLKNINLLYLEVNQRELYLGCPLVEDLDIYLKDFGFERVMTEWCGNFGWGDAIYIKNK